MNKVYANLGESIMIYNPRHTHGLIEMQGESPSNDHVAQEDGTWVVLPERINELYKEELMALNPMVLHINMHLEDGEEERAARARHAYHIAKNELLEKYGKGTTVFITKTGGHYHKDEGCSVLIGKELKEVKLSDGLKNYDACTICSANE